MMQDSILSRKPRRTGDLDWNLRQIPRGRPRHRTRRAPHLWHLWCDIRTDPSKISFHVLHFLARNSGSTATAATGESSLLIARAIERAVQRCKVMSVPEFSTPQSEAELLVIGVAIANGDVADDASDHPDVAAPPRLRWLRLMARNCARWRRIFHASGMESGAVAGRYSPIPDRILCG
jgi:hypothetical protein